MEYKNNLIHNIAVMRTYTHVAVDPKLRYLVLLADRKKARMFTIYLNKLEETFHLSINDVPQNVKANDRNLYGRSDKIFRHIEDHLHRHLQIIGKTVGEFVNGKRVDLIILGGHKYLIPKIRKHLPKSLAHKAVATFVTELNIPFTEVVDHSLLVIEKYEEQKIYEQYQAALL